MKESDLFPGGLELDLSKSDGHEHPDVIVGINYAVKIGGQWFLGKFCHQWYGLNFSPWLNGTVGIQFDAPGWNSSKWERIIQLSDDFQDGK